ncbi:MAG: acyl-CoA dehydrogenase C-terminal domain-containing protein, partial [Xanthobacteraceae bacterium]
LDLVGRKLPKDGGRALRAFFGEVAANIKEHGENAAMSPYVTPLGKALGELQEATMWFVQHAMANPDNAGAGATDYMHLFGLVALGYMWCLIAQAAQSAQAENAKADKDQRMAQRLTTARFFMERILPVSSAHLARIKAGAESTMALSVEAF